MNYRIEKDSMGEVKVPDNVYWGAQTQRSFENFKIGSEKMPWELIEAIIVIKRSAAVVNNKLGVLDDNRKKTIIEAADILLKGEHKEEFPLSIWQTGSGTQTNMNVNEVIAHLGNENVDESLLHPNDHVNKSQSTNDVFPTAINMAVVKGVTYKLIPSMNRLAETFEKLSAKYDKIIKIGRTHCQDAVPLKLSQELSSYANVLREDIKVIEDSLGSVRTLAIGGTAVGTGLNAPDKYDEEMAKELSDFTKLKFYKASDKFVKLAFKNDVLTVHSAIKTAAMDAIKIANDIRFLASGPRCGIGELIIPANEPGSSIMPGKVNPTQVEALTMLCARILGNDTAISFAASQGNFELNVYMPLIGDSIINSINLLADGLNSFNDHCIMGLEPNEEVIKYYLDNSLMLVTALNPHIGYENSAKIAKKAYDENKTLKEAAIELGLLSSDEFDQYVKPEKMV